VECSSGKGLLSTMERSALMYFLRLDLNDWTPVCIKPAHLRDAVSLECSCFAYEFIRRCECLEESTLRQCAAAARHVLTPPFWSTCSWKEVYWKNVSCSGGLMSLRCTAIKNVSRSVFSPGNCLRDVNLAKTPQAGVVHERKDHWSDWRLPSVHLLKVACVLFCSKAGNLNFTQFWLTGSRV